MPIIERMKGVPQDLYSAEGLMYQDWNALTPTQRSCSSRLGLTIQREQEDYLFRHPEILAMLKIFIALKTRRGIRKDMMKEAAYHFTRPAEVLDAEIRTFLESPEEGPYVNLNDRKFYDCDDENLLCDLRDIIVKHYPPETHVYATAPPSIPNTPSSSFLSIQTSEFTLPTPEPIPTPDPTISEIFYNLVSNTVDKAIYVKVDERSLLYDTAYVELMKAVEEAMEIPVIDIRLDIADLFYKAYRMFEVNIMDKEAYGTSSRAIAYLFKSAEIAWEKRMRKKLKKMLRRQDNFKGYETPPTPKSEISSHESYKRPPPRPCDCQPLAHYNRYGKDRYGIYLPSAEQFSKNNVTTTPDCESPTTETPGDDKMETKSSISNKTTTTGKNVTIND